MKRIRNLGLAAAAALALTAAIGTASAAASGFVTDAPGNIESEGEGLTLAVGAEATSCETPELIPVGSAPINTMATLPYIKLACESNFLGKGTLELNSCSLQLHAGEENAPGWFGGSLDVAPPGCGPIRLNKSSCDYLISSVTGVSQSFLLFNEANSEIPEDDTVTANPNVKIPASYECREDKTISLTASWEMNALAWSGAATGLHVGPVGVFTGKGGFEATTYPNTLAADQDPAAVHHIGWSSRRIECETARFIGDVSGPTASLTADGQYGNCKTKKVLGITYPATVKMNSCQYVFGITGGLGIACSQKGDAITASLYKTQTDLEQDSPFCVNRFGPQEASGAVKYSNTGSGSGKAIAATLNAKLSYEADGKSPLICGSSGGPKEAFYEGGSVFRG